MHSSIAGFLYKAQLPLYYVMDIIVTIFINNHTSRLLPPSGRKCQVRHGPPFLETVSPFRGLEEILCLNKMHLFICIHRTQS